MKNSKNQSKKTIKKNPSKKAPVLPSEKVGQAIAQGNLEGIDNKMLVDTFGAMDLIDLKKLEEAIMSAVEVAEGSTKRYGIYAIKQETPDKTEYIGAENAKRLAKQRAIELASSSSVIKAWVEDRKRDKAVVASY